MNKDNLIFEIQDKIKNNNEIMQQYKESENIEMTLFYTGIIQGLYDSLYRIMDLD